MPDLVAVSHTPAYGHVVYLQLLDDQGSLLPIYVGKDVYHALEYS